MHQKGQDRHFENSHSGVPVELDPVNVWVVGVVECGSSSDGQELTRVTPLSKHGLAVE